MNSNIKAYENYIYKIFSGGVNVLIYRESGISPTSKVIEIHSLLSFSTSKNINCNVEVSK